MNRPNSSNEASAIEGAALNLLSYLKFRSNKNNRLGDIARNATGTQDIMERVKTYLKAYPEKENLILVEQSREIHHSMPKTRYDTRGFNAYTFKDPAKNSYIVVYRGTASGGWIQNGVAFGPPQYNTYYVYEKNPKGQMQIAGKRVVEEHLSTVQAYAINYFNYNAVKFGWDESSPITVTGHSQGDCNAKLVTLTSPLVDNCYGFNGPNFSRETISELQSSGELYEAQRGKISLYRTEDDQISVFGCEVVEERQIYYVKGNSPAMNHEIEKMLSIIHDERGDPKLVFNQYLEGRCFWSTTLKKYNNILIELPIELRGAVAIGMMWFAQTFLGRETSAFDDHVELWNICLAVVTSGIIIPKVIVEAVGEKYGVTTQYIAALLMGFIVILFAPVIIGGLGGAALLGLMDYAISKLLANEVPFAEVTKKLIGLLVEQQAKYLQFIPRA